MIHYLKFASKEEAISIMSANEPELLWNDNGMPRIKGSHDYAIALIGQLTHATGIMLPDGIPEQIPVSGYHVNINCVNRPLPDYLNAFKVYPVTPSITFGE